MILNNTEYRIFLSAMRNERELCKKFENDFEHKSYDGSLVDVCKSIEIKVRNAVDVVRCNDCKNKTEIIGYPFCEKHEFCCPKDSEYFCAYGERTENNGL